jgi:hypothetical protein
MSPVPSSKLVRTVFASALLAVGAASSAFAADTVRVRGTVTALSGNSLQVKSREGANVTIALAPGWAVSTVVKVPLASIKPGDFVGIASQQTAGGTDGALEVLVFPAAMKGTGEGSYDWDLKPQSSMTNGSVTEAVTSVDGSTVNVMYHGQSKKIAITAATPIVTFAPATVADIKPGAPVFVPAQRAADGTLSAGRLVVGKDGVAPPM